MELVRRRLEDAVAAIADPVPMWDGGVCRWSDAVYVCLRRELSGGRVIGRRQRPGSSRLPCRLAVLELLVDIDGTVGGWEPAAKGGTVERLHRLAGRRWRPQDCSLIEGYCARLQRWAVDAAGLITPEVRIFLPQPCPRCGARHAYRDTSSGEHVRAPALKVSDTGCQCAACGASWAPDRFHWLARLLGCPPLPA